MRERLRTDKRPFLTYLVYTFHSHLDKYEPRQIANVVWALGELQMDLNPDVMRDTVARVR